MSGFMYVLYDIQIRVTYLPPPGFTIFHGESIENLLAFIFLSVYIVLSIVPLLCNVTLEFLSSNHNLVLSVNLYLLLIITPHLLQPFSYSLFKISFFRFQV